VKNHSPATTGPMLLGIDSGATRTVALLGDSEGRTVQRIEAGPANSRLLSSQQLSTHFLQLAQRLAPPAAVAIGLAGVREEADRRKVRAAAAQAWPGVPCFAGNDLETALAAAGDGLSPADARIILISGTGSCCYGKNTAGQTAKVGGWGHILGDKGSGYEIGLRALKAVLFYYDRDGIWPPLGRRLLRALQMNEPNDLVDWALRASKPEVAALAPEVFGAWSERDRIARDILLAAAESLGRDAAACAARLAAPKGRVEFFLTGSVLLNQPRFVRLIRSHIHQHRPNSFVGLLNREAAQGAVYLARQLLRSRPAAPARAEHPGILLPRAKTKAATRPSAAVVLPEATQLSPTEARLTASLNLDRRSVLSAVDLMLAEESKVCAILHAHRRELAQAVSWITASLRRGGRLFYAGAGTSGRLGVLDASECPPTFSVSTDTVQGIIAGGQPALWTSIEGAEDDSDAGRRAIEFRGVTRRDVVVGIAASGRTPFVWGALDAARRCRARRILVCFNPFLRFAKRSRPDLVIAPLLGAEVLTGSTRLKAGTATKLILNLLTTLSMVRLGKVVSNLMVDVNPANAKLRDRAERIVRALTGAGPEAAHAALVGSGWIVKTALRKLKRSKAR